MTFWSMNAVESTIRNIYLETATFYDQIRPRMGAHAFGFKILYGPPLVNAPIAFVGINPGGSLIDKIKGERIGEFGEHGGWPPECEYADSNWKLARALQNVFKPSFLKECTGLNANFFRSPSEDSWKSLPHDLRRMAENFSAVRAQKILSVLAPRLVVIIGFGLMDKLRDRSSTITNVLENRERILIRSGTVFGFRSLALRHLSASRITVRPSPDEMIMIRDYFMQYRTTIKLD